MVKDSLFELVFELFDRAPAEDKIGGDPVLVIVSDLHIDTWEYPGAPNQRVTKFNQFLDRALVVPTMGLEDVAILPKKWA